MDKVIECKNYKDTPKQCGVYEIINNVTGDKYVGSSKNIYKRLIAHAAQLRSGGHCNKLLLHSFKKHGEDNFSIAFKVTETEAESRTLEQQMIDSGGYRYNLAKFVESTVEATDAIYVYSNEGKFIKSYSSVKEASENLCIDGQTITYNCMNFERTITDFKVRFSGKNEDILKEDFTPSDASWIRFWFSKNYTIYEWDLLGNRVAEHKDLNTLLKELSVTMKMFTRHLNRKYFTVKKRIFSLVGSFPGAPMNKVRTKPVLRLNEKGDVLERYTGNYLSLLESQGYPYSCIIDALKCRKGTNKSKGMFWKYDDGTEFKPYITDSNCSKVRVVDITTGVSKIFDKVKDCGEFLGISRPSIHRLLRNPTKVFRNKYRLEYLNE
jgi:hypothetical protein